MRAFALGVVLFTSVAHAYPGAPAAPVSETARADAKKRFDLAMVLFDEGDGSGALAELTRAWELTGNLVVLYNIGIVQLSLGRYVQADAALTEVLAASPDPLKSDQRKRAVDAQQKARSRIGTVTLTPKLPEGASADLLKNAIVELDGVEVARWPMTGPLRVSVGKHAVGLIATGHAPLRREVTVAGQTTIDVEMPLVAMAGKIAQLEINVSVVGATVILDGTSIGTSPLNKGVAVAPGQHVVEAKRVGYVTASSVVVATSDTTSHASLSLAEDPVAIKALGAAVVLTVSEPPTLVEVDGAVRSGEVIGLPPGPHSLRVEKSGFLPTSKTFTLEEHKTTTLSIALVPTPETLAAHDGSVSFHRTWGIVGIVSGVAFATAGAVLYFPARGDRADAEERRTAHLATTQFSGQRCHESTPAAPDCAATAAAIDDDRASARLRMNLGLPMLIGGPIVLATGAVLLFAGPSSHRFESVRPQVALAPGGGYLGFSCAF
jgi:hypothetical protein